MLCSTCNILKSIDNFYKNRKVCKICYYNKTRQYQENNKDKRSKCISNYKKKNKSKIKEYNRVYQQEHLIKFNFKSMKRHAAKLNRTPKWLTKEDWLRIKDFYIFARVLTAMTGIKHEVDHIIPLQGENVSGLHVPWNLQVLTREENRSKNNKILLDNFTKE